MKKLLLLLPLVLMLSGCSKNYQQQLEFRPYYTTCNDWVCSMILDEHKYIEEQYSWFSQVFESIWIKCSYIIKYKTYILSCIANQ